MTAFNKEEVLKDWEMKLVWDASFEDGKLKAQKEVAKNMLVAGLAVELIAELTDYHFLRLSD